MAASSSPRGSRPLSQQRVPLRIRLNNGFGNGELSGAWWPQSRDIAVEFSDLVDHLGMVGRVSRLLYSRPDWEPPTTEPSVHHLDSGHGRIRVGSFPSDDTHLMVVVMASGERLRLLVVPSDTSAERAEDIMERAADERCRESPAELLGIDGPDQSEIGADIWDADAGNSL